MDQTNDYFVYAFLLMVTLCFFLAWFFWKRARHRELMLMIEKGMDPAEHMQSNGKMLRKIAIILFGFSAGAIVIEILQQLELRSLISGGGFFAVFAICIGISLLIITRSSDSTKKD